MHLSVETEIYSLIYNCAIGIKMGCERHSWISEAAWSMQDTPQIPSLCRPEDREKKNPH